jgi:SAM-dependent methyltransferase
MTASTDAETLKRQYADKANLSARASIYAFQEPRVPLPSWVLDRVPEAAKAGRVLDVGCGPGWYVARAAELGASTVGLDLSLGMVTEASRACSTALGWVTGDAARLPIRSDSFDAALALHMLYHVPDPSVAVAELRRVVRPGGTVLAVLNGLDHMDTFRTLTAEAARRTEWLPWSSSRVNLNHVELFEHEFGSVTVDEVRARIVLTDVGPLLAYAGSAREFYEHRIDCSWDEFRERFARAARRHLADHGTIEITTHTGAFVSTVDG